MPFWRAFHIEPLLCMVCGLFGTRYLTYRKTSSISRIKSQNLNVSCITLHLSSPNPLKPGVEFENEEVVGAAPTGDAPTTSELSTILLPAKVQLILDVLRYLLSRFRYISTHLIILRSLNQTMDTNWMNINVTLIFGLRNHLTALWS